MLSFFQISVKSTEPDTEVPPVLHVGESSRGKANYLLNTFSKYSKCSTVKKKKKKLKNCFIIQSQSKQSLQIKGTVGEILNRQ